MSLLDALFGWTGQILYPLFAAVAFVFAHRVRQHSQSDAVPGIEPPQGSGHPRRAGRESIPFDSADAH